MSINLHVRTWELMWLISIKEICVSIAHIGPCHRVLEHPDPTSLLNCREVKIFTSSLIFIGSIKILLLKNVKKCCPYLWLSVGAFEWSIHRISKNFSIFLLSRKAKSVIIQNGVVCSSCHIIAYLNIPLFFYWLTECYHVATQNPFKSGVVVNKI
jgi:hypothetical protein